MTEMTEAQVKMYAQVTLALLEEPTPAGYLDLIERSKTELGALEAGMHGLVGPARDLQQRVWSAQHKAQLEIVKAALAAGVPSDQIRAITWREG